jgi:hypothetical protein
MRVADEFARSGRGNAIFGRNESALFSAAGRSKIAETIGKQRKKPRGLILGFSVKSYPRKFRGFERLPESTLILDLLEEVGFANAQNPRVYVVRNRNDRSL